MALDIASLFNAFTRHPIRAAVGVGLGAFGLVWAVSHDGHLFDLIWNPWAGPLVLVAAIVFGVGVAGLIHEAWVWIYKAIGRAWTRVSKLFQPHIIRNRLTNLADDERNLLQRLLEGRSAPPYSDAAENRHIFTRLSKKGIMKSGRGNPNFYAVSDVAWIVILEDPAILNLRFRFEDFGTGKYLTRK